MFIGILPTYVDRFARVWHRLSTTDLASDQATTLIINDFVQKSNRVCTKNIFVSQIASVSWTPAR